MLIKKTNDSPSFEITPRSAYLNRRNFMTGAAALGVAGILDPQRALADGGAKLQTVKSPLSTSGLTPTSYKDITSYNNFYEFGVEKDEPSKNAGRMKTRPWTVTIDGLVKEKKKVGSDELLSFKPIEERVYRHRCVEARRWREGSLPSAVWRRRRPVRGAGRASRRLQGQQRRS